MEQWNPEYIYFERYEVCHVVTFYPSVSVSHYPLEDKYNDFIEANRMENASDRLKTMKKLV